MLWSSGHIVVLFSYLRCRVVLLTVCPHSASRVSHSWLLAAPVGQWVWGTSSPASIKPLHLHVSARTGVMLHKASNSL